MQHAEAGKQAAAEAAARLVEDGMMLGIGTGSTVSFLVEALGRRVREEGLHISGVATSLKTEAQALSLGITLIELGAAAPLDLAIDGADEVEQGRLRLIKGLGGALLREKIVAQAARRFVVIVDEGKVVTVLGEHAPVPVEVVYFAHETTARRLAALGGGPVLRVDAVDKPFVTDNGNLIYDCHGFSPIADPVSLERSIRSIAGVVETGLFLGGVEQALIGCANGSVTVMRPE